MKRVDALSVWSSPSDLEDPMGEWKKESGGRDPPQGVAPHAHRGVVADERRAGVVVASGPAGGIAMVGGITCQGESATAIYR